MKSTTAATGLKATATIKLHWAIPEKTTNRKRVENMEFPGALKKEHMEIPGVS